MRQPGFGTLRIMRTLRFELALAAVALFLAAGASVADTSGLAPGYPDDIQAYDPREVALLPNYCKYTQLFEASVPGGSDQVEKQRWKTIMGPTFNAMHHYCWGLMKTNRALLLSRTRQTRTYYLASSVEEFNYVLQRAPADFALNPEILTKKGENLLRLGRNTLGIESLQRAIEMKPDYWPPYAALADFYKKQGDTVKARDLLEKALALAPDAKGLKNRLRELDRAKAD